MDWGSNRGLSWAVLRHKASRKRLLVYGAHPVCCGNENLGFALSFQAFLLISDLSSHGFLVFHSFSSSQGSCLTILQERSTMTP